MRGCQRVTLKANVVSSRFLVRFVCCIIASGKFPEIASGDRGFYRVHLPVSMQWGVLTLHCYSCSVPVAEWPRAHILPPAFWPHCAAPFYVIGISISSHHILIWCFRGPGIIDIWVHTAHRETGILSIPFAKPVTHLHTSWVISMRVVTGLFHHHKMFPSTMFFCLLLDHGGKLLLCLFGVWMVGPEWLLHDLQRCFKQFLCGYVFSSTVMVDTWTHPHTSDTPAYIRHTPTH